MVTMPPATAIPLPPGPPTAIAPRMSAIPGAMIQIGQPASNPVAWTSRARPPSRISARPMMIPPRRGDAGPVIRLPSLGRNESAVLEMVQRAGRVVQTRARSAGADQRARSAASSPAPAWARVSRSAAIPRAHERIRPKSRQSPARPALAMIRASSPSSSGSTRPPKVVVWAPTWSARSATSSGWGKRSGTGGRRPDPPPAPTRRATSGSRPASPAPGAAARGRHRPSAQGRARSRSPRRRSHPCGRRPAPPERRDAPGCGELCRDRGGDLRRRFVASRIGDKHAGWGHPGLLAGDARRQDGGRGGPRGRDLRPARAGHPAGCRPGARLPGGGPVSSSAPAPPFLLVASGASRLADPARRGAIVVAATAAIAARTGSEPEVRVTASPAEGRAATREAIAAGAPLVVVAGGDGSVRSAAAALGGSDVRLGIVPAGTGNLLAAALGIRAGPIAPSPPWQRPASGRSTWDARGSVRPRRRSHSSWPPALASMPG